MSIAELSPLLVNQIAAGEVIERPASVVKELVDNALDAGAGSIDVKVEDGGRELVRIADDGSGIPADEMPLALRSHATSKIAEPDDLGAIATLGFRGEALASILSVSRLRLTSRVRGAEAGAQIEGEGDRHSEPAPIGCAPGTIVEVRNLFHNTPARRKFLRTAGTEFGHINDAVTRLAMAHPAVGFRLAHNERKTFEAPPAQSPRRRCLALLGEGLADGMLEFESEERGIGLWGLAGQPSLARSTTKHQYVYVNGRPVRDRNVMHAVKEAYRGLIEPTQHPMLVLFVTIDPAKVDVNVHPSKSEVRFAEANAVHGQVLATIRQRLLGSDLTPTVSPPGSNEGEAHNADAASGEADSDTLPLSAFTSGTGSASADERRGGQGTALGAPGSNGHGGEDSAGLTEPEAVRRFVDYFRRMDPKQKGFVYEQVRREMGQPGNGADAAEGTEAADDPEQGAARNDGDRLTEPVRTARSVLQVHDSYLVTQDEQGLLIIDQHALHERVMFQTLQERIRSTGALESQRLLTPATVQASPGQMELLERLRPLLDRVGIEAEPLGPGSIGIHAFATLLFDRGVDPAAFLTELLEKAEAEGFEPSDEAALHEVLDMMSCKAAVKAGDSMRPEELGELLNHREQVERSSNCPHGRPTTVRLTLRDLEKHFKRS